METARTYSFFLRVLITIILLLSVKLSHSISVDEGVSDVQQRKKTLGSRPPGCMNKCMNCKPCRVTLVIPPHHMNMMTESSHREEDSYYLLSWKCKCGDRLFQP